MDTPMTHEEAVRRVGELIKDIRIATLSTIGDDGDIHSRPMATMDYDFTGDLWFFTSKDSEKVQEVGKTQRVGVAFADIDKQKYVTLTGNGELVTDRAKIEALWNPLVKAWFHDGLDDPNLALLKIEVDRAEFWDGPHSKLLNLFSMVKSAVTGKTDDMGEHGTVSLQ